MSNEDRSEAKHEPTAKRISAAVEQGDTLNISDLFSSLSLGFVLAGLYIFVIVLPYNIRSLSQFFDFDGTVLKDFSEQLDVSGDIFGIVLSYQIIFAISCFVAVLTSFFLLVWLARFRFSITRVTPKIERITPKIPLKASSFLPMIWRFGLGSVRSVVVTFSAFLIMREFFRGSPFIAVEGEAIGVVNVWLSFSGLLVLTYLVFAIITGGCDFYFQRRWYRKKLMLSDDELKREVKEAEGDPLLKSKRKQLANSIHSSLDMSKIKDADVVVVNPTHVAIAISWNWSDKSLPIVVAKGADEMSALIRQAAISHGVPIYKDVATARGLFLECDIGECITPKYFEAVAGAFRFVFHLKGQAYGNDN